MYVLAGQLRNRVEIQRPTATQNAYGEETVAYAMLSRRWARVQQLTATERMAAQSVQPEATHRVTIRPLEGLAATDRIVWGNRTFEILTPPTYGPEERRIRMELTCREINVAPTSSEIE